MGLLGLNMVAKGGDGADFQLQAGIPIRSFSRWQAHAKDFACGFQARCLGTMAYDQLGELQACGMVVRGLLHGQLQVDALFRWTRQIQHCVAPGSLMDNTVAAGGYAMARMQFEEPPSTCQGTHGSQHEARLGLDSDIGAGGVVAFDDSRLEQADKGGEQ
ncbi:hypothetical protein [Thioalkalivibrio sp. ALE28]|uniref:hypothetical protein n=1 Tax=Thioalkalivibrio sp. ALE28 TaxID=1158179 RepID=UPI000362DA1A|nr:hypothetical protein [Thioalkalivibrio sp. ALE28]